MFPIPADALSCELDQVLDLLRIRLLAEAATRREAPAPEATTRETTARKATTRETTARKATTRETTAPRGAPGHEHHDAGTAA